MNPTEGLAYAHGKPELTGTIKTVPEDFLVEEILSFEPSGSGEHAFVQVEKWGENTDFIARQLARFTNTKPKDVGFAGLKDRHGRTTQWFSVQLPGQADPEWEAFAGDQFRVTNHTRNDRKLRRGALRGNRFTLTIRDLKGPMEAIDDRLHVIARMGVPNYFGPQRFGRDGNNVEQGLAMLNDDQQRVSPHLRGILLSAMRSEIFNQILSLRVLEKNWNCGIPGDVFMFPDSKSHFEADASTDDIQQRLARLEIHPSGPLVGAKPSIAREAAASIEERVFESLRAIFDGVSNTDLETMRRPYRLVPENLEWNRPEPETLAVSFTLPAGAYATTVLREVLHFDKTGMPEL